MATNPIDRHFKKRGLCPFCGHRDANHGIFDDIYDEYLAPDRTARELAHQYGISIDAVHFIYAFYERSTGVLPYGEEQLESQ